MKFSFKSKYKPKNAKKPLEGNSNDFSLNHII